MDFILKQYHTNEAIRYGRISRLLYNSSTDKYVKKSVRIIGKPYLWQNFYKTQNTYQYVHITAGFNRNEH